MGGYSTRQSAAADLSGDMCMEQTMCVDPSTQMSQDFGSNEQNNARVQGSDLTDRSGQVREAVHDMGEVRSLDGGFTRTSGALLDALLPNAGDKGKLQINVNVPVDQSGTVRVSFEFVVESERDENGVKGRIQLGGGVTATQERDLYFVTVNAFARAMVFGYLESYGDRSAEMFELALLGIQQRIAAVSEPVADAVFDARQIRRTLRGMDQDDYVESGLGASLDVGASLGVGDDDVGSASAGVAGQTGTRLSSDGAGGLRETDVSQVQGTLGGNADPFALGGKILGKWQNGRFQALEAELSGEAMLDASELNEIIVGGRWLSGVIGQVAGIVSGGAGVLQDGEAARRGGGLASFLHQSSGTGVLAEAASARALAQLEGMGVKLGHKITVKGTWDRDAGYGLDIALERVSQIEFGENPRDLVYVLVESVQRVFRIQVGG